MDQSFEMLCIHSTNHSVNHYIFVFSFLWFYLEPPPKKKKKNPAQYVTQFKMVAEGFMQM